MEVKDQEKFLEIKKEVVKMIENKKEKLKENNIKVDIMNDDKAYWWLDKENSTIKDILKNLEKSLDYFLMED